MMLVSMDSFRVGGQDAGQQVEQEHAKIPNGDSFQCCPVERRPCGVSHDIHSLHPEPLLRRCTMSLSGAPPTGNNRPDPFQTLLGSKRGATATGTTQVATPTTPAIVDTELLAEFIDICDTAIDCAFDLPSSGADVLPGIDVPSPVSMLKAYLLYVACEAPSGLQGWSSGQYADWYRRVSGDVWRLLGFGDRPPPRLRVELAFAALSEGPGHQAPELRALVFAVEQFTTAGMLRGLRS